MKSLLAISAGFISMIVLEGFARLVISFYHRLPLSFTGIESIPSTTWAIFFLALILFLGFFGALLTTTIANFDYFKHSVSLAVLVLITRFIPLLVSETGSSLFYSSTIPVLSITGIFFGFILKKRMDKKLKEESDKH